LKSDTNISISEHRCFFKFFINHMYTIKHVFIGYPLSQERLDKK
jgi:hypothetical protein